MSRPSSASPARLDDRPRRRRARGAARRGSRRRAAVGRDPGLRPVAGGRRDRGVEDVREGRDGGGRGADGGERSPSRWRPACSRPTVSPRERASSSAGHRPRSRPGSPSSTASPARSSSRSCSTGPEISVFALCDGVAAHAPRGGAGLQARRTTATAGRTPAGWARSRRSPASATSEVAGLVDLTCRPVLAELAARGPSVRRRRSSPG